MLELSTARVNSAQISTVKIWTIAYEKVSKYIVQSNDQDISWVQSCPVHEMYPGEVRKTVDRH